MEPALDERGDRARHHHRPPGRDAAMEPALDERGDVMRTPVARMSRSQPQWSPLSTSGATTRAVNLDRPVVVWPQWSPLSTSGATGHPPQLLPVEPVAAMEPALDERGDSSAWSKTEDIEKPQWSPLSTSGATVHGPDLFFGDVEAAMEPALDERGDASGGGRRRPHTRCRNGARSRRAGRLGASSRSWWNSGVAAMEPALDERGDPVPCERRRRAHRRRNGARSRRAGRPASAYSDVCDEHAAMEPALDERGDHPLLHGLDVVE